MPVSVMMVPNLAAVPIVAKAFLPILLESATTTARAARVAIRVLTSASRSSWVIGPSDGWMALTPMNAMSSETDSSTRSE